MDGAGFPMIAHCSCAEELPGGGGAGTPIVGVDPLRVAQPANQNGSTAERQVSAAHLKGLTIRDSHDHRDRATMEPSGFRS